MNWKFWIRASTADREAKKDLAQLKARLKAIDWTDYRGGVLGESIPWAMVALVSKRDEAQGNVRQYLEQALLPSYGLAEVTYYALPFLLELAAKFRRNIALYSLLGTIATCARSGEDACDEEIDLDGKCCSLSGKCREKLAAELPLFLSVIQDPECPRSCRSDALWIVNVLSEWRAEWLPVLAGAYEHERDPEIRKELAEVLAGA